MHSEGSSGSGHSELSMVMVGKEACGDLLVESVRFTLTVDDVTEAYDDVEPRRLTSSPSSSTWRHMMTGQRA